MIAGYTFVQLAVFIVVLCAIIALVFIAMRQFGIAMPPWVVSVFWVVVVAAVVIFSIKLVAGM